MVHVDDIHSLTDFTRHSKDHIKRLKKTGRPEVLTVNGKAEVIVQDAKAYQELLDIVDQVNAIEGIKRGLDSKAEGKGKPYKEVFDSLRKKHDIPVE